MAAWMSWGKKAAASIAGESKEALADTREGHPHFMMPDGWIEVVELTAMPGT